VVLKCATITDDLKFFANTFIIFYLYEDIKHVAGPTQLCNLINNEHNNNTTTTTGTNATDANMLDIPSV
jgi:hypothetical protein